MVRRQCGAEADRDQANNKQAGSEMPLAELRSVTVELGSRVVLRDVSAQIRHGEFVGVIGPNGAGKSTLVRVLCGVIRPTRGEAYFQGGRIGRGNARIGYCPQTRSFDRDLPFTGRDFVGLGLDGHRWGCGWPSHERRTRIDEMLRSVDALGFADTPIGRLSGGEQQRLAIAQAMIAAPSLLLLDEPLASLDMRSQGGIVALVERLRCERGITVLFVTHSLSPLLAVMDRVWYLAGGRAAIGQVDEVIRPDVLSQLYGSSVDVVKAQGRIFVLAGDE